MFMQKTESRSLIRTLSKPNDLSWLSKNTFIPMHSKDLKRGLIKAILKDIGIADEELPKPDGPRPSETKK